MSVASRALGSKYELLSPLGSGAMGEVWRARDRATGEPVAAKVLRSELSHDQEVISRFVRERTILTSLAHPGIVRVRDLVVEGDELAIVMDLVEGSDLRQALRESGTLPPATAAGLVARVLDALAVAHAQGALHRDVKPDNVLLTQQWRTLEEGEIRLSDFSIARLAQESTVQATGLLGTPEYMPPELFAHGTTSAASDTYAAGVVLYELLAGRTPFAGPGTAFTIGNRAVTMQPPALPVAPELLGRSSPRSWPRTRDSARARPTRPRSCVAARPRSRGCRPFRCNRRRRRGRPRAKRASPPDRSAPLRRTPRSTSGAPTSTSSSPRRRREPPRARSSRSHRG